VKQRLLAVACITASSAVRIYMRPDTDVLSNISCVDLVNQIRSLIEKMLLDGNYNDRVVMALLLAFFNNIGSALLVRALYNGDKDSLIDVIKGIYRFYEVHGLVVNMEVNMHKLSSPAEKARKEFTHHNRHS